MHESVELFRSTALMVDALSRFAYDELSHVRCIFWEPESIMIEVSNTTLPLVLVGTSVWKH